jgi:ubiquinone/menaquinone biosynthesis C-methylase UbiE
MRALKHSLLREIRANAFGAVSVLDVGAGSGELLRSVRRWLGPRKSLLIGAEINAKAAREIYRGSERGEIEALRCDALRLPFADDSFDHVYGSLFLHHLTDDLAVEMLREMARVASGEIFIVDLHRSPVAYYFYRFVSWFTLQQFTREDGALSILRSFKPAELLFLGEKAGLQKVMVRRSAAYRLILSGRK